MDATTTPSLFSLIETLKTTYPQFTFSEAERFSWSPSEHTIFYTPKEPNAVALLLHELSHGLLGHREYRRDVELVAMETAAWEEAEKQAKLLSTMLDDDVAQDHIDTYREWLHARSTCPECKANGYQTGASAYECPACTHTWRVNEARICALRRYSTTK
ncbi:MAG: hypothetical protein ACREGE_02190 [Candidatus Microsaccharimonas sp.]